MHTIFDLLRQRGLLQAVTSEELYALSSPLRLYIGFDPTSDCLHLGNLVGIVILRWFQRFGHTPIAIVGGATGMIGDPSGRSTERTLLDAATIAHNLTGIRAVLERLLGEDLLIINNMDWFQKMSFVDFLRDVGKHFRMGPMLAKESVRTRLESEEGMSFTEFSYQALQAYDFMYLYDTQGITLQVGGSDQWGNITAGIELARKLRGATLFGATHPLVTRSDGKKFGKSEGGAIWLSSDKLSVYDFYQYLFGIPDSDVIHLMCMLTFMEFEEIESYAEEMRRPGAEPNRAQRRLAEEVTRFVHGEEKLQEALRITAGARPGAETRLDAETLRALPARELPRSEVLGSSCMHLLVKTQLQASNGEARRLIEGGGAYLNNLPIHDPQTLIREEDLVEGEFLLLGVGKKKKVVVKIADYKKSLETK